MQPQIITREIKLIGVQKIIQGNCDLSQELGELYSRLFIRLADIPDISATSRTVGYWHFVDNETKLYFAGMEVDSFDNFRWDYAYGLVAWSLGNSTWAVWKEKDGEEGSIVHGNVCWDWLAGSNYKYDNRFIGDFEVRQWVELGQQPRSDVHEIWIPIVKKES